MNKKRKKSATKIILIIIACFILLSMCGTDDKEKNTIETNSETAQVKEEKKEEIISEKKNDSEQKLMTECEWALQTNYMFAVNTLNFNGDIYEEGTYSFDISNKEFGKAPIYDIYISTEEYTNEAEVQNIKTHYEIGGVDGIAVNIKLKSGQYVYVVPYKNLVYEPQGFLKIKKVD